VARVSPYRKPFGEAPPQRAQAKAPGVSPASRVPHGDPMAHTPVARVGRAPMEHPVKPPPNPRKPKLVRDVRGGALKDLFEMFPDLPRPARPPARVPLRARRLRARR
jgi:hypothetical protein